MSSDLAAAVATCPDWVPLKMKDLKVGDVLIFNRSAGGTFERTITYVYGEHNITLDNSVDRDQEWLDNVYCRVRLKPRRLNHGMRHDGRIYEVLATFPELRERINISSIFCDAWITVDEAAAINARFPGTAHLRT